MSITDERKETFDFSDPYFDADVTMAVAAGSGITSYEDLAGKTVAVKTATNGADYAKSIADQYGFTVVEFKDSPTMYQDVIAGNTAAYDRFIRSQFRQDLSVCTIEVTSCNIPLSLRSFVCRKGWRVQFENKKVVIT